MSTRKKSRSKPKAKPNVRIVFDGVMAVGPGHPANPGDTRPGPFFGVMARTTRRLSDRTQRLRRLEQKANGGKKPRKSQVEDLYTPMHVPTIFTRLEPATGSRPPDQVLQFSPFHPKWYLWHPIRERLEFRFDGDGTPGNLEYDRVGEPIPEVGAEGPTTAPLAILSIENVPDLRDIWPARSVLLDGLLSADPGVSDKVATQVFVPYGKVAGAGTLDRGRPLNVVFDPPRGRRDHPSLVPNAAVTVQARNIEIVSYSLDSGDRLDTIKLVATENAEVFVSNGDPSDVELDINKLAIEFVRRFIQQGGRLEDKIDDESTFASGLREFQLERPDAVSQGLEFWHHGSFEQVQMGLAIHRRLLNVDIDFELYYKLMKDEHLARDGRGLPVPKRPAKGDVFSGPNCYIGICDTDDKLFLKSNA
jgi:hypothetical protein